MQDELEQRLNDDAALIRTLRDVQPSEAGPRLQPIYDDIQKTLRVPLVNYLFRALANWPDYLERAWPALAPGLGSRGLERGADMLRSAAVLTPPEGDRPDWNRMGDMSAIEAFTDTIHYVLPKLVIVATCLDLELAPEKPGALPDPADRARLPHAVAPGTKALPMVAPDRAQARVVRVFDEIRRTHGHPAAASYYRGIAQWPEFLDTAWKHVRPVVTSEPYRARKRELLRLAQTLVEEGLSGRPLHSPGQPRRPAGVDSVARLFRYRMTVDLLLDVGLIQSLLHGVSRASQSPFSEAR